ncbi:MAG TPA: hypothetical protein VG895_05260 [Patescibacteria group bacterium]|nr:hypothetical protein [Patescibacteria group bacterium]
MPISDPQFLFMILVLPGLFGLTMIGEGVHKITTEDNSGLINIIFGLVFLGVVAIAYIFFTRYYQK